MYTILAVDDAKDTLMLLEFDLVEEGYKVITAESGEIALELLENTTVDLILLDMYMPGISGLELLEKIKKTPATANIPVIMLSASNDEDQIVSALELGADDYVTKPYIAKVLLARMGTSFRLMEKNLALEHLAKTDFLTGVSNRGCFEEQASKHISKANRSNSSLVIVMLDIDFFKQVNDKYGHESGDKVLISFAKLLQECFRDYDSIGRIGGEEFAVCMPDVEIDGAITACERLREAVKQQRFEVPEHAGKFFSITVSIGLTSGTGPNLNFESLLREADKALYHAKRNGRDQTINAHLLAGKLVSEPTDIQEQQITLTEDVLPTTSESLPSTEQQLDNTEENTMSSANDKFPGIDHEIGVGNVLGDNDLFEEILVMFYEDHAKDDEILKTAIAENDLLKLKHVAHTLKGVASSIGAMELFENTKALDIAINEEKVDEFASLFPPVESSLQQVVAGLEAQLADKLP